jgi:hypothetical protein
LTSPTPIVELGRLNGWVLGESLLGTDTTLATYIYSDITSRVMDFSVRRGRQHELDRIEAGTATLTLINQDGAFTPSNTSSVYYPDIRPMAPIRIRVFDPTDITGLRIWADASQESYTNGQSVGTFTDRSGNANHFTQATEANKPIFTTNVFNGFPVLRFDGSNDNMQLTTVADASQTRFAVLQKRSAPTGSNQIAVEVGGTNATMVYTQSAASASAWLWFADQAAVAAIVYTGSTATNKTIVLQRVNSATSMDYTATGATWTNINPDDLFTTGTTRSLGSNNAAANFSDVDVAEYIEYDSALTATQLNLVGNYLAAKYGLAWTAVS